jgi:hypothetical protein
MDSLLEMLNRGVEQLLGRAGGPLHFRLFVMPLVVTFLAVRAGLKGAREGQPPFLWTILSSSKERRGLIRSAVKDVGRIFIVAVVLDTTYQLVVLRAFYPVQLLIIAVGCAVLPYLLIRGPVSLLMRSILHNQAGAHRSSAEDTPTRPKDPPAVPPEV